MSNLFKGGCPVYTRTLCIIVDVWRATLERALRSAVLSKTGFVFNDADGVKGKKASALGILLVLLTCLTLYLFDFCPLQIYVSPYFTF